MVSAKPTDFSFFLIRGLYSNHYISFYILSLIYKAQILLFLFAQYPSKSSQPWLKAEASLYIRKPVHTDTNSKCWSWSHNTAAMWQKIRPEMQKSCKLRYILWYILWLQHIKWWKCGSLHHNYRYSSTTWWEMDKIQHVMHHFSSAPPPFTVNICAWCSSNRSTHCSATVEDTATLSEVSLSFHRWFRPRVTARSVPSNHTLVHEAASSRWEDTTSNSSQQQRWPPGDGRRKDSFYSNLVTGMIMCVFFISLSHFEGKIDTRSECYYSKKPLTLFTARVEWEAFFSFFSFYSLSLSLYFCNLNKGNSFLHWQQYCACEVCVGEGECTTPLQVWAGEKKLLERSSPEPELRFKWLYAVVSAGNSTQRHSMRHILSLYKKLINECSNWRIALRYHG